MVGTSANVNMSMNMGVNMKMILLQVGEATGFRPRRSLGSSFEMLLEIVQHERPSLGEIFSHISPLLRVIRIGPLHFIPAQMRQPHARGGGVDRFESHDHESMLAAGMGELGRRVPRE